MKFGYCAASMLVLSFGFAFGSADGHAGQMVPLKIGAQLTLCTAEECPEAVRLFGLGGPNRLFAVDVGNATHFGRFRTIYACDVFPDGTYACRFLLTAADGSTIAGRNRGILATPGNPGPFEAWFDGGTKRLRNATGFVRGIVVAGEGYQGLGWIILNAR